MTMAITMAVIRIVGDDGDVEAALPMATIMAKMQMQNKVIKKQDDLRTENKKIIMMMMKMMMMVSPMMALIRMATMMMMTITAMMTMPAVMTMKMSM